MSDKERKSFTLEKENAEMCEGLDNASAVVDDLLTQYRESGDKHTVGIDLQIRQKEKELTKAERDVERIKSDIEELKQLKAQYSKQEDAELSQARDELEGAPRDPANPAIKNWAGKLGMTPQELIEELE